MFRNEFLRVLLLTSAMIGVFTIPAGIVHAQDAPYAPLGMDDLENLAGPVALYPDAVLAQVLTASTYPLDVVAAAQWLDAGNNPATVDSQPWDDSVKGLINFPDILHYMASNVDWMNSLGDAFINQSADVMTAVQDLRAEALSNGSLVSDDNQQVVQNGNIIQIIPANPETIYIPIYDPAVIYVRRTPLRFDHGYRVGLWLDHDLDWVDHRIYTGNWGANRPWWHPEVRGGHPTLDYTRIRPGDFHATGAVRSNAWQRDEHRPAPVFPVHAPVRPPDRRPGTGYPPSARAEVHAPARPEEHAPARPEEHAPAHPPPPERTPEHAAPAPRPAPEAHPAPAAPRDVRGAVEARNSQRGSESRARATPAPARPAPAPAARPSEPAHGGAGGEHR